MYTTLLDAYSITHFHIGSIMIALIATMAQENKENQQILLSLGCYWIRVQLPDWILFVSLSLAIIGIASNEHRNQHQNYTLLHRRTTWMNNKMEQMQFNKLKIVNQFFTTQRSVVSSCSFPLICYWWPTQRRIMLPIRIGYTTIFYIITTGQLSHTFGKCNTIHYKWGLSHCISFDCAVRWFRLHELNL